MKYLLPTLDIVKHDALLSLVPYYERASAASERVHTELKETVHLPQHVILSEIAVM